MGILHSLDYCFTVGNSEKEMDSEHCGRKHSNLVIQEKTKRQKLRVKNFGNTK